MDHRLFLEQLLELWPDSSLSRRPAVLSIPMNALLSALLSLLFVILLLLSLKANWANDDSLDAFGVHGVGGNCRDHSHRTIRGKSRNAAGADGLLFGNAHQLVVQSLSFLATVTFAVVMTFIIFKIVDAIIGMRVEEKNEIVALDLTQTKRSRLYRYE